MGPLHRFLLLLSLALGLPVVHGSDVRPNILWITCEDLSPRLGCYGDKFAISPNIDAFARQSVRYTRAFATAPACSPSRACLITGMYATSLGNPQLRTEIKIPKEVKGYGQYFREAGYFTSNNVKTDYNLDNENAFKAVTWSRCDKDAHWRQRKEGERFFSVFNLTETHQSRTNVWPWEEFEKQIGSKLSQGTRAIAEDVPLPSYFPDTPLARRTFARLYDCIQAMDTRVGEILKQLEEDGLADNTIVFFYSDHGDGIPRGKRTLYDSGMHIPLLIRFPEKWKHLAPAGPGESVDRLVSFVDFPPTVLSLAGLPIPEHMQGVPFLGPLAGKPRTLVIGARDRVDEAYELSRSVRDARWLYVRNYLPHLSWIQPEGYSDRGEFRRELAALARDGKLQPAHLTYAGPRKPLEELYDTEADPEQLRNLAAEPTHADRLSSMRKSLRDWILESRDLGFMPESILFSRLEDRTPREFGKDAEQYPLERILAAAENVGAGGDSTNRMPTDERDPAVRYWHARALQASDQSSPTILEIVLQAEQSEPVRIQLASALLNYPRASEGQRGAALKQLEASLASADEIVALEAARALELAGPSARAALPALQAVFEKVRNLPQNHYRALYLRFSTEAALRQLGVDIPREPLL